MKNQSLLVVFIVVSVAVLSHCAPPDHNVKQNEIATDEKFKPDPKIPKAMDPRFNKMGNLDILNDPTIKAKKPPTTKDETSTICKFIMNHKTFIFLLIFTITFILQSVCAL
jgi:hypothetical protein